MQPAPARYAQAGELARLQTDFPQFRIWREITRGRGRYVARSLHPDARPHTVVTPDPAELRAALIACPGQPHPAGGWA